MTPILARLTDLKEAEPSGLDPGCESSGVEVLTTVDEERDLAFVEKIVFVPLVSASLVVIGSIEISNKESTVLLMEFSN